MKETLDAIYENGLLRPLKKLSFPEGRRLRVTLEAESDNESSESLCQEDNHQVPDSGDLPPHQRVREALKGCKGELFIENEGSKKER